MKSNDTYLVVDNSELSIDELMESLSEAFRKQLEQSKDPLVKVKCSGAVMEFRLLPPDTKREK